MSNKTTTGAEPQNPRPSETVRLHTFGCVNCLWVGIECQNGSRYRPQLMSPKQGPCAFYTYYD